MAAISAGLSDTAARQGLEQLGPARGIAEPLLRPLARETHHPIGRRRTGTDPDHADAIAYAAASEQFREGDKPGIAGNAADIVRVMGARRVADDVDDGAAAARLHERIEGAGHVDGAEHLQIPGRAPSGLVDVEQCAAGNGAGVVDEDVDIRKLLGQPRHIGAVRKIGGVGADGDLGILSRAACVRCRDRWRCARPGQDCSPPRREPRRPRARCRANRR